jgi:hypothetical protein
MPLRIGGGRVSDFVGANEIDGGVRDTYARHCVDYTPVHRLSGESGLYLHGRKENQTEHTAIVQGRTGEPTQRRLNTKVRT